MIQPLPDLTTLTEEQLYQLLKNIVAQIRELTVKKQAIIDQDEVQRVLAELSQLKRS